MDDNSDVSFIDGAKITANQGISHAKNYIKSLKIQLYCNLNNFVLIIFCIVNMLTCIINNEYKFSKYKFSVYLIVFGGILSNIMIIGLNILDPDTFL